MARRARQVFAGEVHMAMLIAKPGLQPLESDALKHRLVAQIRDDAAANAVRIHAFGVQSNAVYLLLTPPDATALSRVMKHLGQTVTRAQLQPCTSVWEGRYRCTAFESASSLVAQLALESVCTQAAFSSAQHWAGNTNLPWLAPLPAFWALGNTPFGRQAAYLAASNEFAQTGHAVAVMAAAKHGWPQGSPFWVQALAQQSGLTLDKKSPGRKLSPIKTLAVALPQK